MLKKAAAERCQGPMRSETLLASTRAALHGVCQALQPGSNFASRLEAGFAGIINGRDLRRGENDFSSGRGDETEKPAHAKIDLALSPLPRCLASLACLCANRVVVRTKQCPIAAHRKRRRSKSGCKRATAYIWLQPNNPRERADARRARARNTRTGRRALQSQQRRRWRTRGAS